SLRAGGPGRRALPLDLCEEAEVLPRFGDLVLLRAPALDVGRGRAPGDGSVRLRGSPRPAEDPARPADPGLDFADGRARLFLGRSASLARHPRRVPVANARRRARAAGVSGAGENSPSGNPRPAGPGSLLGESG